jgi:hypothetical protein
VHTRFHFALLLAGMIGAILFGAVPLVDRRYTYAPWCKVAALVACIAGVAWGTLGLILYHSRVAFSPHLFGAVRYTKAFVGGISAGLIAAVLLARPWHRRKQPRVEQPNET